MADFTCKTRLGNAGPSVFSIALGCMGMPGVYGAPDENESIATIREAIERGLTLFDAGDFGRLEALGRGAAGADHRKDEHAALHDPLLQGGRDSSGLLGSGRCAPVVEASDCRAAVGPRAQARLTLMDFVCRDPRATVRAADVRATLEAFHLVPSMGRRPVEQHQLRVEGRGPDQFVPIKRWLDALKEAQELTAWAALNGSVSSSPVCRFARFAMWRAWRHFGPRGAAASTGWATRGEGRRPGRAARGAWHHWM
jgi:hypothetical protein